MMSESHIFPLVDMIVCSIQGRSKDIGAAIVVLTFV